MEFSTMQAGRIEQPHQAASVRVAEPTAGPEEVVIRVRAAGICGTDVHIYKGEYEAVYPLIPGHEFAGEVAAVGASVTRFRPGDRVTADPNIPCNRCSNCQRNEPNQCKHLAAVGVTRDGGFAEYVVVHEGNVFPIGAISFKAAALIEPLACVVWGLKQVEIQPGDSSLIFGAGPMGCLLLQAVRHAGAARVVLVDTVPWRLELAARLGATETLLADDRLEARLKALEPDGYDIVTDATGAPAVIAQTFGYTRARGKVWIFGVAPRGSQVSFPPYEVFRRDLRIIGSFAVNRTFPQSIAMIQQGLVQVEPLVSHELPLSEFARGFELAQHDPGRMKIQFQV
ncbi:MAG: zinc-dependent alcohol dehydrogenase family protein [Anaerolineae bacterium]|nr:zinc-dependent alcohol dehydrogenase family protein [Anaerolineae bacterium]